MTPEQAIGETIAWLRKEQDLSQAQLGEALAAYLGKAWSRQAVHAAEKGQRAFTAAELLALATVLNTSVPFLFASWGAGPVTLPSGKTVSPSAQSRSAPHGAPAGVALAEAGERHATAAARLAIAERELSETLRKGAELGDRVRHLRQAEQDAEREVWAAMGTSKILPGSPEWEAQRASWETLRASGAAGGDNPYEPPAHPDTEGETE